MRASVKRQMIQIFRTHLSFLESNSMATHDFAWYRAPDTSTAKRKKTHTLNLLNFLHIIYLFTVAFSEFLFCYCCLFNSWFLLVLVFSRRKYHMWFIHSFIHKREIKHYLLNNLNQKSVCVVMLMKWPISFAQWIYIEVISLLFESIRFNSIFLYTRLSLLLLKITEIMLMSVDFNSFEFFLCGVSAIDL